MLKHITDNIVSLRQFMYAKSASLWMDVPSF